MSEAYVECLVKAKTPGLNLFFKYLLYMLTVALAFLFLLTSSFILMLLAVAAGVGAYFVGQMCDVEYEYLYLDKELSIDKIMGKSRRKRVATYKLQSIEIFAPIKSYHLDNFGKREGNVKDYSIGYEDKPDLRYVLYYEGGEKLLLSPSPELVKIMKNAAPRKVFND